MHGPVCSFIDGSIQAANKCILNPTLGTEGVKIKDTVPVPRWRTVLWGRGYDRTRLSWDEGAQGPQRTEKGTHPVRGGVELTKSLLWGAAEGKGRPSFLIVSPTHSHASTPGPLSMLFSLSAVVLSRMSPMAPSPPPLLMSNVASTVGPFLATLFKLAEPTVKLPVPTHAHSPLVSLPSFVVSYHLLSCIFYAVYLGTSWGAIRVLPRNALGSRW